MTIENDKYKKMLRDAERLGADALGANADQMRDFMSQLGFDLNHHALKFAGPTIGVVTGGTSAWLSFEQFGRVLDIALSRAEGRHDPDHDFLVASMVAPVIAEGHADGCDEVDLQARALAMAILAQLGATIIALRSAHREWGTAEDRQILDDVRQFILFVAKGVFATVARLREN